jgi:hypothetical protein
MADDPDEPKGQLPANLEVIGADTARLPENYLAAIAALETCASIDQAKEWANRMEALGSYARQAKDHWLRTYALRIKARAMRRVGELLQEIPGGQGARDGKRQDGSVPPLTRTSAAIDAGLTERERRTALRLANVRAEDFRAAIESDNPPSVTKLTTRSRRTNSAAQWKSPAKIEKYRAFVKFLPRMCTAAYVVAKTAPHLDREEREHDAQVITDAIAALQSLRRAVDIEPDDVPPTVGTDGQEQA